MSTATSNTSINFTYPQHSSKWSEQEYEYDEDYDYCDEYDDYDDFNIGQTSNTASSTSNNRRQQPKQGKSGGSIYSSKHVRAKEAMRKRVSQTHRRK
mmetsp:Transcript_22639/g.55953  ORF Transcript_22639/g.55953 Transcript_22639/m.55953 type:complete len:97 (-) Transcript_22639:63-353(-)